MNMIPVKSSAVSAIGHAGETLTVQYASGGLYKIEGVTIGQFESLLASESIGRAITTLKVGRTVTRVENDPEPSAHITTPEMEAREQLRDGFAKAALTGWTSNNAIARIAETNGMDLEAAKRTLAEGCYEMADAMLAAREK